MIKIISKKEGFRRCGIAHPVKAKFYDDKRFSDEELKILKADVMLVVEAVKKTKETEVKNNG